MPPEQDLPAAAPGPVSYELRLVRTVDATGFFAAVPTETWSLDEAIEYLQEHPLDEFMHRHLLQALSALCEKERSRILSGTNTRASVASALLAELAALERETAPSRPSSPAAIFPVAAGHRRFSPLIDLRSEALADQDLHRRWSQIFRSNTEQLNPMPPIGDIDLPLPFSENQMAVALRPAVHIDGVHRGRSPVSPDIEEPPSPEEIARLALSRLSSAGLLEGGEMRHETSLSPVGLLRRWRFDTSIRCGRLHYRLSGIQTSYGRGFSLDTARARCLMEIVERASAFASVDADRVCGRRMETPLFNGTFRQLDAAKGPVPLDPNQLRLEVPYDGEPLYWIKGERVDRTGSEAVLVPFQCVFLFANLDETALFSGLASTGLASGASPAGARLSALMEVIERDAESVGFFDPNRCFRLAADDPFIDGLLADYRARGVDVFFQDITGGTGIPCFKAFVCTGDGAVAKGTGAHLDGRFALLSALTEVPYPYPSGPPSAKGPGGLPVRQFETLPHYAVGRPEPDLSLTEAVLLENGYAPIYVDITRADLQLPVVRALVPGLEIMTDFDRFSRFSPRHFAECYRLAGQANPRVSIDSDFSS
ncbi:MAG: YcaO-like family protein [Desulfobacterales bacterium]|jgi:ribosomal protein S12 methylthiotransferase accessory factor YcaO